MMIERKKESLDDMIDSTIIGAIGPAVAALTAVSPVAGGITGAAAVFALVFWRIARTMRDRKDDRKNGRI